MKNLAKTLGMSETVDRYAVSLVAVALKDDNEIDWDRESKLLVGYNEKFGTVQTYPAGEAEDRASDALDRAVAKLRSSGFKILCSPKTVDVDNHDWRRIARVRTPKGQRVALVAYLESVSPCFDPWIY